MIRLIAGLLIVMAVAGGCLGGGDKQSDGTSDSPTREATAGRTAEAPDDTPTEQPEATGSEAEGSGLSSLFESVLGGGLGGASGSGAGLGAGDPALKALLPTADQFPDGFTPFGEFTFSSPDGVSEGGSIDMAISMAMSGEINPASPDLANVGMIMAMVMRPEDLQDLGDAFGSIDDLDPDDLEAEVLRGMRQSGDLGGMEVSNVDVYNLPGIGDGGFGMQMTFDLGEAFGGLLGGTGDPNAPQLDSMTMRMHVFANGDYVGATLRIGYADTLPENGGELALARAIDANLAGAQ